MKRKTKVWSWVQDLLLGIACIAVVVIVGVLVWYLGELIWVFRCAFGGR